MIFDYILNNRFYTQNDDAASPYADIIPTTPHNRLETFLNMIVGEFKGMAAVDPIKPISEMEYWLNEIAAAKDGNPWKDIASKFVAKKISFSVAIENISGEVQVRTNEVYSIIIDTGLKDIPYSYFVLSGKINGVRVSSPSNGFDANSIVYFDKEISDGELVKLSDYLPGITQLTYAGDHASNDEEVLPGLCLTPSDIVFIREKGNDATIKLQLLLNFFYNDEHAQEYNNEAEELIFDTIDLTFNAGGNHI